MKLFCEVPPPERHAVSAVNRHATWITWSPAARSLLPQLLEEVSRLGPPELVHLSGGAPYNSTYSFGEALAARPLRNDLVSFARAFTQIKPQSRILCLTELFFEDLTGETLAYVLAFVRDVIARSQEDDFAALYTPLGATGLDVAGFPLHADLYKPETLLNVFDDVPLDESGASLFVDVPTFFQLLRELPQLPLSTQAELITCLTTPVTTDRYERFVSLLYDENNEWTNPLFESLQSHQMRIRMTCGEGYLINDRQWLHGRDAPTGGVSPRRLHRLVFSSVPEPGCSPTHGPTTE